jgi:hypothetical protein
MNVEYGYAIVIPVAVFIAGWCFYDTTCRGKCRRRREPESESGTESESESVPGTESEEKLEEDIP